MILSQPVLSLVAQTGQPPTSGIGSMLIFMVPLLIAMYFFTIAPQRKKEKEHKKMLGELKAGDKVVTIGGIFGTITSIKDDRFGLRVDEGTRIEVLKSAVQGRQVEATTSDKK